MADLVTVWAKNAALADAAATHIAGAARIRSSAVQQRRARDVDPMSDLGDMLITTAVGRLSANQRRKALNLGVSTAEKFCAAGIIRGAVIRVQQDYAVLDLAGEYSPEPL